jgi:polynucleotide 5'-hydroxyl-kinase GRC3/NOL9
MSDEWPGQTTEELAEGACPPSGIWLFLGATDTGKTTLVTDLARRLARGQKVAVVDADVGQSHIGPPTTVGWALAGTDTDDLAALSPEGIAFVGDVTPVGHLLQLTAALAMCVHAAKTAADVVLVDTPGLVSGAAAAALWWAVQTVIRPGRIVATQRGTECGAVLAGLNRSVSDVKSVTTPAGLTVKSPAQRQNHRKQLFARYFRDATVYNVSLDGVAVRTARGMPGQNAVGHIVALSGAKGVDRAIGVIEDWPSAQHAITIRAPKLSRRNICCVTVGEAILNWAVDRS